MSGQPDPAILRDLLECWVLDCAGALPEERERAAAATARSLLPAADDWRVALRLHFDLAESFASEVADVWRQSRQSTDDAGFELPPEAFARIFVERHLSELL